MKKKVLVLLFIIILSFILGICINYFISNKESQPTITDPERLFDINNNVPVSNSNPRGNKHVFKAFLTYDPNINLKEFSENNEFYYKKITSYLEYLEYKNLIPEIRALTRDDFINYYLIIAMSKEIDYVYMLNDVSENDNSLTLELLKNQTLSEYTQIPTFSGVSAVLPNVSEVPTENINFTIKK